MQSQQQSPEKPMSAARLAAEQAFMNSRAERDNSDDAPSPVVTVMARRLGVFAPVEHSGDSAAPVAEKLGGTALSVVELRAPRVFLIGGANSRAAEGDAQLEPKVQTNGDAAPFEHKRIDGPIRRTNARRKRNLAPPVTVIYSAMPAVQRTESNPYLSDETPTVAKGLPQQNAASLAKALAEIEPILAAIREAMAFTFDPPASEIASAISSEIPSEKQPWPTAVKSL